MSYLQEYLKNHALDDIPSDVAENLVKFEEIVRDEIKSENSTNVFDAVITERGDEILDIVKRLSAHFKDWNVSLHGIWQTFQFVLDVGFEVYQIVLDIITDLVGSDATDEEKDQAIVEVAKSIVYMIWCAINPLAGYLRFIPFKKTIEKLVVKWLTGLIAGFAVDLFDANEDTVVAPAGPGKKGKKKIGLRSIGSGRIKALK